MATNPVLIQNYSPFNNGPAPLVLFHDGGGTVFDYFSISSLGRNVYGISNPRFDSQQTWGDLKEMAETYSAMIRALIPADSIILGGWSFGGYLSVEIAHILITTSKIKILGIVMIDTLFPRGIEVDTEMVLMTRDITFSKSTPKHRRKKVLRCFEDSCAMLAVWEPPRFDDEGIQRPPVVLLRASKPVPLPEEFSYRAHLVDSYRDSRVLGWDQHDEPIVSDVYDIQGHHYNIFHPPNADSVSEKLRETCLLFDENKG